MANSPDNVEAATIRHKGRVNRRQVLSSAIIAATAIIFYLCYLITAPFIASLIWALALAVLGFPAYRRLRRLIANPNVAAGVMVTVIALAVVVPLVLAARQTAREVWRSSEQVREVLVSGQWREYVIRNETAAKVLGWVEPEAGADGAIEQVTGSLPSLVSGFLSGSAWLVIQMFFTFFALFFFFRDAGELLSGARGLLPLTKSETDRVFKRVEDTIYATVYGEILIAVLQGVLGGLAFWALGLPAPVTWGFVIALLAFLPAVGTWMVWVPAAVYLFTEDRIAAGVGLLIWGVVGLMIFPSFLYPVLVGDRLRLHTLLVLISILGGIMTFGATGIILGPLALSLAVSLINIWKERLDRTARIEAEAANE